MDKLIAETFVDKFETWQSSLTAPLRNLRDLIKFCDGVNWPEGIEFWHRFGTIGLKVGNDEYYFMPNGDIDFENQTVYIEDLLKAIVEFLPDGEDKETFAELADCF